MKSDGVLGIGVIALLFLMLTQDKGNQGTTATTPGSGTTTQLPTGGVSTATPATQQATPSTTAVSLATPPSSNPVVIAQVQSLQKQAIAAATTQANNLVATGVWTPTQATEDIANAQAANAAYWQAKGF